MIDIIYCNNCGSSNPVGSKFCSQCGTSITLSPSTQDIKIIQPQVQNTDATCPICGRDHETARVSAIVASQTTTGRSFGYSYSTESSYSSFSRNKTALAETLSKPNPPFHSSGWAELLEIATKASAAFIALIAGIVALIMLASNAGAWTLCPSAILVLSVWFVFEKNEPSQQQLEEIEQWEKAVDRWERSYYCSKCDKVFLTENGSKWHINASGFRKGLLYGNFRE